MVEVSVTALQEPVVKVATQPGARHFDPQLGG